MSSRADLIFCRRVPAPVGSPYPFAMVPADDRSAQMLEKVPLAEIVAMDVRGGRSLKQLRTYWAVLEYVSQSTEWTPQRLHVALKVKLGHYDLCEMANGRVVPVVHSASFDGMKHAEFCDYMNKAFALICETILGGYDPERLVIEAQSAMGTRERVAAE